MNRRVAVIAGVSALAIVLVAVVARHADAPHVPAAAHRDVAATPARTERDPMVGLPDTAEGARDAALRLTALAGRAATMPIDDAAALQRQVGSSAGGPALAERLRVGLRAVDELGNRADMQFWVAPLGVAVLDATAASADVQVWYVGVLDVPNLRTSQQWRTVRYRLVWERGGWRDDDESAVDGPEPQHLYGAQADDVGSFDARLVGFTSAVSP